MKGSDLFKDNLYGDTKRTWKLKPEILTHPNIPKPLHGINPRSIMGEEKWNKIRKEAYASTDNHCVACGVHKSQAIKHQWLECHEYWSIDYRTGRCEVISLEPLCHYCHNFIHSGRLLQLWRGGKITKQEAIGIIEHGFGVLRAGDLKGFYGTFDVARLIGVDTSMVKFYIPDSSVNIEWQDWVLIYEGKEYRSKFKNYEEWEAFYSK